MDSNVSNSSHTKKRPPTSLISGLNKKPTINDGNDQLKAGVSEYLKSNYNIQVFIKMIEEGSMVLHPKNQFIKFFKSVIDLIKGKLFN
jgi:hypothetical protein